MTRRLVNGLSVWVLAWLALASPLVLFAAPTRQLDEDAIRQAVAYANSDAVYSAAYRMQDPDALRAAWAGEALLDMQEDIAGLRTRGLYLELALDNLEFTQILELGPGRVRVVTVERWIAHLHNVDGDHLGTNSQTVQNRYLLERRGDTWLITEVDQEIQGGGQPARLVTTPRR